MFGRATIRLGISPHSSSVFFSATAGDQDKSCQFDCLTEQPLLFTTYGHNAENCSVCP